MKLYLEKLLFFLDKFGFLYTIKRVCKAIFNRTINKSQTIFNIIFHSRLQDRFTYIYGITRKMEIESVSGEGSTLEYTKNLRLELPIIFDQYSIDSVFDAPCGDFNWMKEIILNKEFSYTGVDIVNELIELNIRKYSSQKISFFQGDLTDITYPKHDLMICRDLLFHLSYKDSFEVISRFLESEIKFLLTTTHKNISKNKDIRSGDFKMINIFLHPYNFPLNPLRRFDDWVAPYPEREMVLFSREQIASSNVFSNSFLK
jgi:ubiquinone/menaquinone biosynthesis C-methylase UbiE